MARSLKKGPFADESLLKKVDAMNAAEMCIRDRQQRVQALSRKQLCKDQSFYQSCEPLQRPLTVL